VNFERLFYCMLKIPGKTLLFGEYGVKQGYPAVACLHPSWYFLLEIKTLPQGWHIESDFFSLKEKTYLSDPFWNKIYNYFHLFVPHFQLKVLNSFEPSLGFGSSSALLAGIIFEIGKLLKWSFEEQKRRALELLHSISPQASGYDVLSQLWYLYHKKQEAVFLVYQNQEIEELQDFKTYGFIVPTGIYAPTSEILKEKSNLEDFPKQHGLLAEEFLKDPCKDHLKILMEKSRNIALKHGILDPQDALTPLGKIHQEWKDIPFKTLGAGCGDSFWCLELPSFQTTVLLDFEKGPL